MWNKEAIIEKLVETEWKMFNTVSNIGGEKAACQEDYLTFEINRFSQFKSWSEDTLQSYFGDLKKAEKEGRNLYAEKYARMMQAVLPEEYAAIKDSLPPVDPESTDLINKITNVVLEWEDELKEKYPAIFRRMRPLRSADDSPSVISLETYLKGELATYSVNTLKLYLEHVLEQKSACENGARVILSEMIKRYGFRTLEEANEYFKRLEQ